MPVDKMVGDYKKMINKGNIFDLAIGVIIGSTFTAIVNSLVSDIITPLISIVIKFDLTSAKLTLKAAELDEEGEVIKEAITLNYGNFFQNVIKFLIVSIAIFVAVKIVKKIKHSYIKGQINYIKKLKKKHPEFFDEADEFGTKLYEKLKKEHPEEFISEEAKDVEKATIKASKRDPQEIANDILYEINDNLEKLAKIQEIEQKYKVEEQ